MRDSYPNRLGYVGSLSTQAQKRYRSIITKLTTWRRHFHTGTRTRVCWVRASYPNRLDYMGRHSFSSLEFMVMVHHRALHERFAKHGICIATACIPTSKLFTHSCQDIHVVLCIAVENGVSLVLVIPHVACLQPHFELRQ